MINTSSGGFEKKAFKNLFEAEEKSFWFKNRNKLIIYYLKKYFPDMKNYLEIGCGTGYVLKAVNESFPECSVTGSELFEEGLIYAKQRTPNANFIQLDAVNMTEKNKYDVFGAFDVLEHISDDVKVMKNLNLVLKNDSTLKCSGGVITVPQHMFMWSETDDLACHCRRYTQKELRRKLESAGFKIEKMTGFVSLLFPFMLVSRLLSKFRKEKKVDSTITSENNNATKVDELHLPVWLNGIFSFVMKIEFILLKAGVKFPFGGSILAIVTVNTIKKESSF